MCPGLEKIIYDIIGDIHGYSDELVQLLEQMGYRDDGHCFRHPDRQALFCGDFVDRGPRIADTVSIVRSMVQQNAAQAVMGNHEFNAIAYHTSAPDHPDEYCRKHTPRHTKQHQATLDQLSSTELSDAVSWFRTLPVALDLGDIRIVHACWDQSGIDLLNRTIEDEESWSAAFLTQALNTNDPLGVAVERVLKGPEVELPDGRVVTDKEGHSRRRVRIRWFESPDGHSVGSYAFPHISRLMDVPVPSSANPSPYAENAAPLFIGHYWLDSRHDPILRPNLACLDLSVARGGVLCGYRFNGESELQADSLVRIPVRRDKDVTAP